ncbi:MAG: hypothetical protein LBD58_04820 [Treponema sp.]|nr:hypothetical protein [Treponema sp.]
MRRGDASWAARSLSRLWIFVVQSTTKIPIIGILRTFGSMAVCAARNRLTGDFWGFMREARQTARRNAFKIFEHGVFLKIRGATVLEKAFFFHIVIARRKRLATINCIKYNGICSETSVSEQMPCSKNR